MPESLNTNNPESKRGLPKRALMLVSGIVLSAYIAAGASGITNALQTNPSAIKQALNTGNSRNIAAAIIENSGKAPICQQGLRQTLEEMTGRGEVHDPFSAITGYIINDPNMCLYGLSGVDAGIIDLDSSLESGFPDINNYDRQISNNTAFYFRNGQFIGSIVNLSEVKAKLITPHEHDNIVNSKDPDPEIIASFTFAATGMESAYHDPNAQHPYLPWTHDGEIMPYLHQDHDIENIIDNPDYVVLAYTEADGFYVGQLTQELYSNLQTEGSFVFVSPFNFFNSSDGGSYSLSYIFVAGAVYKTSNNVIVCTNGQDDYYMITTNAGQDSFEFIASASHALLGMGANIPENQAVGGSPNCVVADDEGNGSYTLPRPVGIDWQIPRTSENRLNPYIKITTGE